MNGDFTVQGAKSFKIDHPLDPVNQYLYHAAGESSEMMNLYSGNVTLDATGAAIVELPAWFEALNQEFRYQLTALGAPGPNLYIAEEIQDNRFTIAGGAPGMKVSWEVTSIRADPYAEAHRAEAHRMEVEVAKPAELQGTYLYPEGYGQPATSGEANVRQPDSPALADRAPALPP
ncbi:MAG: hypothetical protein ACRDIB_05095, partial [Ardenticatenaceae bacterium]